MNPVRRRICLLPALAVAGLGASCDRASPGPATAGPLGDGAVVLVVGDSLTAGYGATPEAAWPAALGRLTGWQVINLGLNGDTTAGAVPRMREFFAERAGASQPKVDAVIIALGGNDMLRRVDDSTIKHNLRSLVLAAKGGIKTGNSHVAIMATPRPTLTAAAGFGLSDADLYRVVAKTEDVFLLRDIYSEVLADDSLRSDQIHANARGYAVIAAGVRDGLRRAGWVPDGP